MKKMTCGVSGFRFDRVWVLGIALFSGLTAQAFAATKVAKPLPTGATDAGVLPSSTAVRATIYLQPDAVRVAALTQFLADVQTPGSASYRQWLSASDFASRFGATSAQIARVSSFVQRNGLSVASTSGLRMVVSGSSAQVEAVFAPGLHQVTMSDKSYVASTNVVAIPTKLAGDVASIGGMDTVPETSAALKLTADGTAITPGTTGSLDDFSSAIEGNSVRVLTIDTTACSTDFADTTRVAMQNALREAEAQGITALAASACTSGDVSFPAVLPDVVATTSSAGVSGDAGTLTGALRPTWQAAPGLPEDTLRHEPDLAVSSLSALASTFATILAQTDSAAVTAGTYTSPARLGNVAQTLYELAPLKGLYTQPDATSTGLTGNWETADGLGLVDLTKLAEWYPRGTLSTYVTVTTTPAYVTHGATATFYAQVKDTSGQGTATPTGTISFATSSGISLGSQTMASDGSVSVTSNQTPAGTYTVVATYSGDTQYASNTNSTSFQVGPEEGVLSATPSTGVSLGGTIVVTVNDKSASGVGTPNVTATVQPQGIASTASYSVKLTGTSGTATGTVSVPASAAGSITMLVSCATADANFSCYNSINTTATVAQATPKMVLTMSPTVVTANTVETLTATITGVTGQVAPTGTVLFFDNGVQVGQSGFSTTSSTASVQVSGLSATATHSFSATYYGDNNYNGVGSNTNTSSGTVASSTAIALNPAAPVAGQTTTITATVASGSSSSTTTPTGTVTFYQDGVALTPVATLVGGVGTYSSTTLSSTASHTYYAVYSGDTTYATSQSATTTTSASGTVASKTTLTVTPNPPVSGAQTTLEATVASNSTSSTAVPAGTVTFYQDGVALTPTVTANASGVADYTSTTLSSTSAHTYYAVYGGSSTYATSTSASVATSAATAGTTATSLTMSPNPPVSGSLTTLTATVAYTANGTAVPTGTVTFYQDGVALTPAATVTGGTTATYTSTTLSGTAAHSYTAKYSGDTNYTTSTSAAVATAAATGTTATTTTLTVTPNPPVSGSLTTLKATLGFTSTGTLPTGSVTFYQDGVALTPAATVASGVASYTSTTLSSTAAHSYTATYSGDTNFAASTSAAVATAASAGTTTTTALTVTPNPPVSGSLTTLKATVTSSGTTTPTGTVTFYQDAVALTPAATLTSGVATYTSTTLSSTVAHSYSAAYSGDTSNAASTSTAVTTAAASTGTVASAVTITASPTTVTSGGTTTLLATVTSATTGTTTVPTGTVTFTSSIQGLLGTAALNSSGVATLSPLLSVAGTGTITAVYNGDSTYAASTSATPATVTVTGTTITPVITLTISPTIASYGGNITLSTTVTAVPTTGTTGPAGSVTWTLTANATGIATAYTQALTTTSTTTAIATATIAAPAVGTYTVTATCTGTNFSCSGLTISKGLSVTKAATVLTLVADPNPPASGQPVLLTAYIASASGAINATCGGNVTFYVNGISAGSAAASGNEAQLVVTLPLANGNVIYAVYVGDANCSASTSSTLTLTLPPTSTTAVVTTTTNTALYSANVVFQMVVTAVPSTTNPNPSYPTGTVTFYDTFNGVQAAIGTASLAQNGPYTSLAQFQTTGLQAGTHTILGVYAGVTAFSPSNASPIVVNITDYSTQFSPSSTTVTAGQTATILTTVAAINGFSGQVVLGCVPPSGSATTCTFSPNVITTGSGIVTLTITTTKATAMLHWQQTAGGVSFAIGVLGLLWPGRRRRSLPFVLVALLSFGLLASVGCTTVRSDGVATQSGGGSTGTTGGTPSGTLQFVITASGTDGKTVNRHDLQYSVTVQ